MTAMMLTSTRRWSPPSCLQCRGAKAVKTRTTARCCCCGMCTCVCTNTSLHLFVVTLLISRSQQSGLPGTPAERDGDRESFSVKKPTWWRNRLIARPNNHCMFVVCVSEEPRRVSVTRWQIRIFSLLNKQSHRESMISFDHDAQLVQPITGDSTPPCNLKLKL